MTNVGFGVTSVGLSFARPGLLATIEPTYSAAWLSSGKGQYWTIASKSWAWSPIRLGSVLDV
jgi:hypothetical protein